jgi:cell division protein FtsB
MDDLLHEILGGTICLTEEYRQVIEQNAVDVHIDNMKVQEQSLLDLLGKRDAEIKGLRNKIMQLEKSISALNDGILRGGAHYGNKDAMLTDEDRRDLGMRPRRGFWARLFGRGG